VRKRWWAAIMIVGAVGLTAAGVFGWKAWRAEWARRHPEAARIARYEKVFDAAWKAVDEHYYDPKFDHVRWRKIRDVYRPLVRQQTFDAGLYINVLSNMLGQLETSHAGVSMPPELPASKPVRAPAAAQAPARPAEALGCDPNDFRLDFGFDPAVVHRGRRQFTLVANVRSGSPAEMAGVTPGDLIDRYNLRGQPGGCPKLKMQITTPAQSPREIAYEVTDLPARPDSWRADLPSGVRVLGFTHFDRESARWLAANLAGAPAKGVILDLRRNGGGLIKEEQRIAGYFLPEGKVIGQHVMRKSRELTKAVGGDTHYGGPLVVLIGPISASAAEITAEALRYHGRARLLGGETAGAVLASLNYPLPDGGRVQVAIADYLTPDGHHLEGVGVKPDIPVAQTLEAIRAGRDLPLEAAERALIEGRRP
jgi:carboxyl-terminal processing protease